MPAVCQALGGFGPALQEAGSGPLLPTHVHLSMSHSRHTLPTLTLSPPSAVSLPLLSACKHVTHFPRPTSKVPPPGSLHGLLLPMPLSLTVLSSPMLDDTGCLGSFPNCFMDTNNSSFCLLSAYCIPGAVLKASIPVNPHNSSMRDVEKWKFRKAKSLIQGHRVGVG